MIWKDEVKQTPLLLGAHHSQMSCRIQHILALGESSIFLLSSETQLTHLPNRCPADQEQSQNPPARNSAEDTASPEWPFHGPLHKLPLHSLLYSQRRLFSLISLKVLSAVPVIGRLLSDCFPLSDFTFSILPTLV